MRLSPRKFFWFLRSRSFESLPAIITQLVTPCKEPSLRLIDSRSCPMATLTCSDKVNTPINHADFPPLSPPPISRNHGQSVPLFGPRTLCPPLHPIPASAQRRALPRLRPHRFPTSHGSRHLPPPAHRAELRATRKPLLLLLWAGAGLYR